MNDAKQLPDSVFLEEESVIDKEVIYARVCFLPPPGFKIHNQGQHEYILASVAEARVKEAVAKTWEEAKELLMAHDGNVGALRSIYNLNAATARIESKEGSR